MMRTGNNVGHSCILCGIQNDEQLSFFKFPKDKSIKEEWLKLCKLDEQNVRKNSLLCQRHFPKEDIGGNENRRVLKRKAIPTLCLLSKKREKKVVDFEDIVQIVSEAQPDLVSHLNQHAASFSLFEDVFSKRKKRIIPCESSTCNYVNINSDNDEQEENPNNDKQDEISISQNEESQETNPSIFSTSGFIETYKEDEKQWERSMSLSLYIQNLDNRMEQKDKLVEELKKTIQSLENQLTKLQTSVSSSTPIKTSERKGDSDADLQFRYAGDIGTPHAETPRRALKGIRVLYSALQQERSIKKGLQRKFRRAQEKIDNLNGVITELRNSDLISEALYTNQMERRINSLEKERKLTMY